MQSIGVKGRQRDLEEGFGYSYVVTSQSYINVKLLMTYLRFNLLDTESVYFYVD